MLQQPLYSLFIRLIPEAFLIMYAICVLTNSNIDYKKIFISSILGATGVYIVRLFPIHFGVHTIIGVMIYILLANKLNNVDIYKSIAGSLISVILIFISDIIVIAIYNNVLQLPEIILGKSLLTYVASLPSLLIYYLIVRIIVYFKRGKVKHE